jgi:hypothetical protein
MAKTQNTDALTVAEKVQATGQAENLLTVASSVQNACSDYGRLKGKIHVMGTKGATLNKKLKLMNQTVTYDTSDLSKLETARLDSCLKIAKAYKLLCGVWILDEMAESL